MMQTNLRLSSAFGTNLYIDISWFFIFDFGSLTLVYQRIEPIPEAIVTTLLLFGSILTVALMQIREARKQGLDWERVTLVPFGNIVERKYKCVIEQETRIAGIGLLTHSLLAILFGGLWFLMPESNPLATELQLVGLFNLVMVVFNFLYRLSPNSDNLLHASLSKVWQAGYPNRFLKIIQEVTIWLYVAAGIVILLAQLNRFALAWWFVSLVILSRIVTLGEAHGEYRKNIPSSIWSTLSEQQTTQTSSNNTLTQFE